VSRHSTKVRTPACRILPHLHVYNEKADGSAIANRSKAVVSEEKQSGEERSSVNGMTRKDFLALVIKRASIAGMIVAAPKIVDKFLIPPVYAAASLTTPPAVPVRLRTDPG